MLERSSLRSCREVACDDRVSDLNVVSKVNGAHQVELLYGIHKHERECNDDREVGDRHNHEDRTADHARRLISKVVHRERELEVDDEHVLTEATDDLARGRRAEERHRRGHHRIECVRVQRVGGPGDEAHDEEVEHGCERDRVRKFHRSVPAQVPSEDGGRRAGAIVIRGGPQLQIDGSDDLDADSDEEEDGVDSKGGISRALEVVQIRRYAAGAMLDGINLLLFGFCFVDILDRIVERGDLRPGLFGDVRRLGVITDENAGGSISAGQFLEGALLKDMPLAKHHDPVHSLQMRYCGCSSDETRNKETNERTLVCCEQHGTSLEKSGRTEQRVENIGGGRTIQGGKDVIQDDDRTAGIYRTGESLNALSINTFIMMFCHLRCALFVRH